MAIRVADQNQSSLAWIFDSQYRKHLLKIEIVNLPKIVYPTESLAESFHK